MPQNKAKTSNHATFATNGFEPKIRASLDQFKEMSKIVQITLHPSGKRQLTFKNVEYALFLIKELADNKEVQNHVQSIYTAGNGLKDGLSYMIGIDEAYKAKIEPLINASKGISTIRFLLKKNKELADRLMKELKPQPVPKKKPKKKQPSKATSSKQSSSTTITIIITPPSEEKCAWSDMSTEPPTWGEESG